jgi:hypothetical protein
MNPPEVAGMPPTDRPPLVTVYDATVRAAFDGHQQRRVDVHGTPLPSDPDDPRADAEYVTHNLVRVQVSLPNGYRGLGFPPSVETSP